MNFCSNCGARLQDGMNFCPSCGTRSSAGGYGADRRWDDDFSSGPPRSQEQENKIMAALAYLLFLIPLIASPKEQKFVRYHTNQGLVLFLGYTVCSLVKRMVLIARFVGAMPLNLPFFFRDGLIFSSFFGLVSITYLMLCVIGIANAVNGRMKPLPLIGRITLLR